MKRKNKILVLLSFSLLFSFSAIAQYDLSMRAGFSYGLIGSERYVNYSGEKSYNNLGYLYKPSYSYEANISRTDSFFSVISGLRLIRHSGTEIRSVYSEATHFSSPYRYNKNNDLIFYTIGIPVNFGFKANKISYIFGFNFNRSFYGTEEVNSTKFYRHSSDGYHYTSHYDTISIVNKIDFRKIKMNELVFRLKIDLNDNLAVDFGFTVNIIKAWGIDFDLKKANFFDFGITYNIKEFNFRNNGTQIDEH